MTLHKRVDSLYDKSFVWQMCMLILPKDYIYYVLAFLSDTDNKLVDIVENLFHRIKTFNIRHDLLEGITILRPTSCIAKTYLRCT